MFLCECLGVLRVPKVCLAIDSSSMILAARKGSFSGTYKTIDSDDGGALKYPMDPAASLQAKTKKPTWQVFADESVPVSLRKRTGPFARATRSSPSGPGEQKCVFYGKRW